MSEKENNNTADEAPVEKPAEDPAPLTPATEPSAASTPRPEPAATTAVPSEPPAPVKSSGGGSSFPGWLALVLVLAVAGGAAWVVLQGMEREKALQNRIALLEQTAGNESPALQTAELEERLQASIQRSVNDIEQQFAQRGTDVTTLEDKLEEQQQAQEKLQQVQDQQQQFLANFSVQDQNTWLRAEAQYLLRLANQRVLMARDPASAIALLQSADNILRDLDDPGLHEVRAAVATEIAGLRAVPSVDVEGIYLRLSALIDQAGKLRIFEAPDIQPKAPVESAENWQTRLRRGYEQAVEKLTQYIVIRRRDVPMQALMDPQWEGLVRQNLRMLLEQSQIALLRGNQKLYRESLERARHWVQQFSDTDEIAAQAMDDEIVALQQEVVAIDLPDLSRSVQALNAAESPRLQPLDTE